MKLKLGREDPFFPLKCIRRPTREKEGEEKNKEGGGELDYLKFRGNYEGHFHYCGNLFLWIRLCIVARGQRYGSSRKTSASRRNWRPSPHFDSSVEILGDGLAPNSFRTTWLRSPLLPYVIANVIRLVSRLSPLLVQEKVFLLLIRFSLKEVSLFAPSRIILFFSFSLFLFFWR